MLMTESILTSSTLDTSATMVVGEGRKRKSVAFAENIATIVARVDLLQRSDNWYSKLELQMFKEKARAVSDYLYQSKPLLTLEVEEAFDFTAAHKTEGAELLFSNWHKLSSSARGLERLVLSKEKRAEQTGLTKTSRSVVLSLQCLYRRSPAGAIDKEQQAEMIRQQYQNFSRAASDLAKIYGAKDEAAVKPYYHPLNDEDSQGGDENDLFDEDDLSDGCRSISSMDSRKSKSAKKVKRLSSGDSTSKKSSKKKDKPSNKLRSKSPLRRARSMEYKKATLRLD